MSGILLFIWRREACGDPDAPHSEHPFEGIELHSYVKTDKEANDTITLAEAKWRAEHNGKHPEWKWLIENVEKEMLADPKAEPELTIEGDAIEVGNNADMKSERVGFDQPFSGQAADDIVEAQGAPVQLCEYSATHMMAGVPATTTIDCGPVGIVPACQLCADFYKNH